MTDVFPFGYTAPLTFYLMVYVLTLVLHVIFMTYVLAGTCYLAWAALTPENDGKPSVSGPLVSILREWMPFALSAAITAGVAPLLFVQILYRQEFYTANLLLGWRWLVVIPVLIVAFYLLYVLKSKAIGRWPFVARCGLGLGIAGSFMFVAFCWTTNHLLQIDSQRWPQIYESGVVIRSASMLGARLLMWISGSFPVMAILVSWQLLYFRRKTDWNTAACDGEAKRLSILSFSGLALSIVFAVIYFRLLDDTLRSQLWGARGSLWLLCVVSGIVMQALGWWFQFRDLCFRSRRMALVSVGGVLMLLGTAFLREMIRMENIDLANVTANVQSAAEVGGYAVFVVFTLVNAGLIGFCLWLIRPALNSPETDNASIADVPTDG